MASKYIGYFSNMRVGSVHNCIRRYFFLFALVGVLSCQKLYAQDEEFQKQVSTIELLIDSSKYERAISICDSLLLEGPATRTLDQEAKLYRLKVEVFENLSMNDQVIKNVLLAYKIYEVQKDSLALIEMDLKLNFVFSITNNVEQRKKYIKHGMDLVSKINKVDSNLFANFYYSYSAFSFDVEEDTLKSFENLKIAKDYLPAKDMHPGTAEAINVMYAYFISANGDHRKAIALFKKLLVQAEEESVFSKRHLFFNLGDLYKLLGNIDSSVYYTEACLLESQDAEDLLMTRNTAQFLSDIYLEQGKSELAHKYLQIANEAGTKIQEETLKDMESVHGIQKRILEKEYLKTLYEKESEVLTYRYVSGLLVLIVIILIVVFLFLRARLNIRFKEDQLQLQKSQMTSIANYLLLKEQTFIGGLEELKTLQNDTKGNGELEKKIKSVYRDLLISFSINKEDIRELINQSHRDFLEKLHAKCAGLNESDGHLATMINTGMSSKQIAVLLGIKPKSVEQHRYRLRKKLGIKREDNLSEFLKKI